MYQKDFGKMVWFVSEKVDEPHICMNFFHSLLRASWLRFECGNIDTKKDNCCIFIKTKIHHCCLRVISWLWKNGHLIMGFVYCEGLNAYLGQTFIPDYIVLAVSSKTKVDTIASNLVQFWYERYNSIPIIHLRFAKKNVLNFEPHELLICKRTLCCRKLFWIVTKL